MSRIIKAGATTTAAVVLAAAEFDPSATGPKMYRVVSNRRVHILVSRAGTVADVNDMFVPAECVEFIRINDGETLSFIRAVGETDGDIWFTEQTE